MTSFILLLESQIEIDGECKQRIENGNFTAPYCVSVITENVSHQ